MSARESSAQHLFQLDGSHGASPSNRAMDSTCVVISQPMFMPWVGMFEQIKLCDHFVFYDDVQLPLGGGRGRGFTTRVQIKTDSGIRWLSLPVHRSGLGKQLICDARLSHLDWKQQHLAMIEQAYVAAPYFEPVFEQLVKPIYAFETLCVSEFCVQSMQRLWDALAIAPRYHISSQMNISRELDASSRVVAICQSLGATVYISGLGAMNYINYSLFEDSKILIHYMDYQRRPYPQLHGPFNPHVSILDLLFNVGLAAAGSWIQSECTYWKDWRHMVDGRPAA
jgi:hypothetical protein